VKIATVIGARPQFIKASAVSRALAGKPGTTEVVIHTGQHYDANMSAVFFQELEIPTPQFNLGIGSGPHGEQTGRQLAAIEQVLIQEKPDCVLVYGDTNSTLAGALAAAKLHLPIAHVEAGLRSFNKAMPEEINRILTDHCSDLLFAPTTTAVRNLAREGIGSGKVHPVGDVMYDVALHYGELAKSRSTILADLQLEPRAFILATIHRAANTDSPESLRVIMEALRACSETMPVVFPVHPRTRHKLESISAFNSQLSTFPQLRLVEPVGYLDMVTLEKHAAVIATDSGGVQKEAFFYGVPCVTLREETEWVELVETGWNRLCLPGSASTVAQTITSAIGTSGQPVHPYGQGDAATRIIEVLTSTL
jgi:UDP-GlcNAc3NAcA epimerase